MRLILCAFCIFLISFSHPIVAKETAEESPPSIPNPLQLEKDWWRYFNVPAEELSKKIEAFNANLAKNLSFVKEAEHREMLEIKDDLLLNLELLRKKISQMAPKEPPPLQLLKEYTPTQILEVNRRLLQAQREIASLSDKIAFEKSRLARIQAELDRQILRYYELPDASFEKLLSGFRMMDLRVEAAIHKTEIDNLTEALTYRMKEKELLSAELKNAKERVSYGALKREELSAEQQELQRQIKVGEERVEQLEKRLLQEEKEDLKSQLLCCLLNYQIITETLRTENANIQLLVNEIKQTLYDLTVANNNVKLQDLLTKWEKTLSSAKQTYSQWQKQLEHDQARASKMIAEAFKEDQEVAAVSKQEIADIHIEVDRSFALLEKIQFNVSGAEQLIKLSQSRIIEEKSLSEAWMITLSTHWSDFVETFKEKTNKTLFYIGEHPVTLGTCLKAIFTITIFLILSRYLRKTLSKRAFVINRFSKSTRYIIFRLIDYSLIVIAFLIALSFVGIDLTNVAIVLGALGVGIGFGLQSVVNNIISGFTLLLNRYLKIGDIVQIDGGGLATVSAINLQFTHICTFEGADQIIPNSQLSNRGLTNWTMQNTYRRFKVPFGVAYGTDKEKLQTALLTAVRKEPYVITNSSHYPDPQLWLAQYGESSMHFELVAWVNLAITPPRGTAPSSLLWLVDTVLASEKIEIPFPQRDLHIKHFPKERE